MHLPIPILLPLLLSLLLTTITTCATNNTCIANYEQVSSLKSGPFLTGASRNERINIVYGLNGIDRSETGAFDPADKGVVMWDKTFDFSAPEEVIDCCLNGCEK
jgi:hypothetical protein